MKKCITCKVEKDIEEFHKDKSRADGRYSSCKGCEKDRRAKRYEASKDKTLASCAEYRTKNKDEIYRRRDLRRDENQAKIWKYFKDHPCVDCGESDPIVLDFDHLGDKHKNVSRMKYQAWNTILKEIEKCEVRCANCHRKRTAIQFNYFSYLKD